MPNAATWPAANSIANGMPSSFRHISATNGASSVGENEASRSRRHALVQTAALPDIEARHLPFAPSRLVENQGEQPGNNARPLLSAIRDLWSEDRPAPFPGRVARQSDATAWITCSQLSRMIRSFRERTRSTSSKPGSFDLSASPRDVATAPTTCRGSVRLSKSTK